MSGLAIESATAHVEVLVCGEDGSARAHLVEEIGHGHTRRLTPVVREAMRKAGVEPQDLEWIATDLGPGSFTGVRVGLATARALALAAGARVEGASSLAALALNCSARLEAVVPLVPAGRRDVYAGYFRADSKGRVSQIAGARVGTVARVLEEVETMRALIGKRAGVRFIGPAVPREREALEAAFPGSTTVPWRFEGLSALDLAVAARSGRGPAAGLPAAGESVRPEYVRPAQAEERVRHRVHAREQVRIRDMRDGDVAEIAQIEQDVFTDPWPASFFFGELDQAGVFARVAEWAPAGEGRPPQLAGYLMAWVGMGGGHLGNIAIVPALRRRGVARVLLEDLFERARTAGARTLTLEVRASNAPAQALYRAHGFRLAGLRRGYYRDSGEDALILERREAAASPAGAV